jgi:ketosteroid isomerase-like protein
LPLTLLLFMVLLSCSPKPMDLVMKYQHAYNSHDLGQLLPLFAEDATFEVVGTFGLKGKDDIRQVAEYDFALHIHMTIDRMTSRGDTVFCELIEMNDWLEAAEIEEAFYTARFIFEKNLIKHIKGTPTPETEKVFQDVLTPLMEWASKEKPERLVEMMPEGKFIYNADNASKSLALLREWREAGKPSEDL